MFFAVSVLHTDHIQRRAVSQYSMQLIVDADHDHSCMCANDQHTCAPLTCEVHAGRGGLWLGQLNGNTHNYTKLNRQRVR